MPSPTDALRGATARMTSLRVVVALVTSTLVTASVAGPLAYVATDARSASTGVGAPAPGGDPRDATIRFGATADGRGRARLDGATVIGTENLAVRMVGSRVVAWYLDDPRGLGPPFSSEPNPTLDADGLGVGPHTMMVRLTVPTGTAVEHVADFWVGRR